MKNPEFLTKAEIARAVAGGYRNGAGAPVWIDPTVAHEIAERIAAASFAKGRA